MTIQVTDPAMLGSEPLAELVAAGFSKLVELRPYLEELWRRFEALKPGDTIHNCKTRKEFCLSVLNRTPRAVQYLLSGGNPVSKRKTSETVSPPTLPAETVSALHEDRLRAVSSYLAQGLDNLLQSAYSREPDLFLENRQRIDLHKTMRDLLDRKIADPNRPTPEKAKTHEDKNWTYDPHFLPADEANSLYQRMLAEPWQQEGDAKYALHYGKSYNKAGLHGPRDKEIAEIPGFLRALADRVAEATSVQVNYIQAHKIGPLGSVKSHYDPSGMIVPMVVVGTERTFLVNGEQIPLAHGSLLTFNGGRTRHAMLPCPNEPNPFEWRISILFRYTTNAMRTYGVGKCSSHGQKKEYENARIQGAA